MSEADPKKTRSDRRRRKMTVIFRVTPEEHARLAEEAANTGLGNVNAWARAMMVEAAGRPEMNRKDLTIIVGHLGKIGTNINQIAKVANTDGRVDLVTELRAAVDEMRKLQKRIVGALE